MKAGWLALGLCSGLGLALWASPARAQDDDESGEDGSSEAPSIDPDEAAEREREREEARAKEAEPEVLRYPPSSVRLPLIMGGVGLFGVAYGLTALSSRVWDTVPGADHMLIPVVGPWVALAQSGCAPEDTDGCTVALVFRSVLLVLDGIAQGAALGLVGEGLFMTTEANAPEPDATSLMVTPNVGPHHTGLSLTGTF